MVWGDPVGELSGMDGKVAELPEELYAEMYDIGLLELMGRTPNAVKDSRFVVLTNNPNITFEEVSKSLYSSQINDSLNVQETIVVEIGVAEQNINCAFSWQMLYLRRNLEIVSAISFSMAYRQKSAMGSKFIQKKE